MVGADLLAMGTAAVMARAMSLGETLVLPSHVVFTLPREELRLFESDQLRDGLTRSLQRAVAQRAEEHVGRLRRAHAEPVTVVGGDLRITMVAGAEREVDARFSGPGSLPSQEGAPSRCGPDDAELTVLELPVLDHTIPGGAAPDDVTRLDCDLRLVLWCDGDMVAAAFATPVPLTVGRDPVSGLVVPQAKEKVSRQALVVTRSGVSAVEVEIVNRNGAWTTERPRGDRASAARAARGRRSRVGPGERCTLRVGEAIELDQAATVSLTLEGRVP
jgi:hypothetical protein